MLSYITALGSYVKFRGTDWLGAHEIILYMKGKLHEFVDDLGERRILVGTKR